LNNIKRVGLLGPLLLLDLCVAMPAYANNPPQPDGLFSILLIFPLAVLGARLAGLESAQTSLGRKISTVIILTAAAVMCMAGTGIVLIPLIIIFGYGIWRAVRIMRFGKGRNRIFVGVVLMAWLILGVSDYVASLDYEPTVALSEAEAISGLRTLATAESGFLGYPENKTTSSPVYGTIDDLRKAHLIGEDFVLGRVRRGYVYGEILDPTKKEFLFYAVPAYLNKRSVPWFQVVPGGSLLRTFFYSLQPPSIGERSFAVDETGAIRFADQRNLGAQVTREEVARWQTFP
jgi:hypothetical protein